MHEQIMIKKASGALEPFNIEKLRGSLKRVGASEINIETVCDRMGREVEDGMTTHDIYKHAFEILHKIERPVATKYSLRRAIMELGPSGFPFEKFVAEILRAQGYEAVTDQMVLGSCVEHEVDVVAWKGDELIMSEVKFHNELGLKTDLKVVLYVKARFEDLEKTTFNYGGKERKLTEGWLVTNTKFTVSAVKYAECNNLKIIGWDFPHGNSLHDMVEKAGLHPITTLSTLSGHDKKTLLEQGIVLCTALTKDKNILKSLGLSPANIDAILEEVTSISV